MDRRRADLIRPVKPAPRIVVEDSPALADLGFLEAQINEFNYDATGYRDGRHLACFVRDADGRILAGLSGFTWGGCCRVGFLWVAEERRGTGLGRALLEAAEAEATLRGCALIHLDTHDFQAPGFYEKLGYEAYARLDDYPLGHGQTFFRKSLRRGS